MGHLYPLACWRRVFSALPPVSPVFSNPFRVGLSRVSLATPRTNAYAANWPVDRTMGRRRSARRRMSVSNAWLPRFRETQHNRKSKKIQLGLPISRAHGGGRSEKKAPVPKDSLSAFASRRCFRSLLARVRTFYCYFMRTRMIFNHPVAGSNPAPALRFSLKS